MYALVREFGDAVLESISSDEDTDGSGSERDPLEHGGASEGEGWYLGGQGAEADHSHPLAEGERREGEGGGSGHEGGEGEEGEESRGGGGERGEGGVADTGGSFSVGRAVTALTSDGAPDLIAFLRSRLPPPPRIPS
eukprot:TRINITY_DN3260_c0_g1_i1.p2 TRINITY_DN3260_c0_g1~~TRINITY_DN3260_c0_g1_i1.p2  ORF type:complete len:137 (-),score=31.41 TRINITY_DN3260_c0_g1_i1:433-843(-)